MADNSQILSLARETHKAVETFTRNHTDALDEIRNGLRDGAERFEEIEDRLDSIETKASRPANVKGPSSAAEREHMARFTDWLRRPHDGNVKNALHQFETHEGKAMSIGSNADGGFAVPEQIAREIEKQELAFSPVRNLVRTMPVASGDFRYLVNTRGATSGWVGETDSRSETNTPALRERAPTFGELYAFPKATSWLLDDAFFDVESWLAEEVAEQFAIAEGTAVISGNGSNKPTGFLNTTPVTTDDGSPTRDANALEYVPSLPVSSPSVAEIAPDPLITMLYTVRSQYRMRGSWVMNSATAGEVRKLKDTQGRYLWTDGLAAGQPAMLLGHPVAIWEQFQDIGTNNFPIGFGDWRRAYLLADRGPLRITVDNNITTPGYVKFYVRRRVGGCILNNDAVKLIRTTIA